MAHPRRTGRWQFIVSARLALPEWAAALSLRANVAMSWLAAPDGDVEAMAEPRAAIVTAWALGGRVERHGCMARFWSHRRGATSALLNRAPLLPRHRRIRFKEFADLVVKHDQGVPLAAVQLPSGPAVPQRQDHRVASTAASSGAQVMLHDPLRVCGTRPINLLISVDTADYNVFTAAAGSPAGAVDVMLTNA